MSVSVVLRLWSSTECGFMSFEGLLMKHWLLSFACTWISSLHANIELVSIYFGPETLLANLPTCGCRLTERGSLLEVYMIARNLRRQGVQLLVTLGGTYRCKPQIRGWHASSHFQALTYIRVRPRVASSLSLGITATDFLPGKIESVISDRHIETWVISQASIRIACSNLPWNRQLTRPSL